MKHYQIKELIALLIKEEGHHEGYFDIAFRFGFATGGFEIPSGESCPSGVVVIEGVGLQKVEKLAGAALDASVVNPAKKKKATVKK